MNKKFLQMMSLTAFVLIGMGGLDSVSADRPCSCWAQGRCFGTTVDSSPQLCECTCRELNANFQYNDEDSYGNCSRTNQSGVDAAEKVCIDRGVP